MLLNEFLDRQIMVEVTPDDEQEFLFWLEEYTDLKWNSGLTPTGFFTSTSCGYTDEDPYCIRVIGDRWKRLFCHRRSSNELPIVSVDEFFGRTEHDIEVSEGDIASILL